MKDVLKEKKYIRSNIISVIGLAIVGIVVLGAATFFSLDQFNNKPDWLTGSPDSLAIREQFALSPPLLPKESLGSIVVEDGFEVKLVAAEPLIVSPVALNFDNSGRMWAVEMIGYMPDTIGTGEDRPSGKIVILEDLDGDGEADHRKLFLDSLVLPRAISLVEGGILVAEPPNLWFVEINNDQPGKKILIDREYAVGGNAEHQANGLKRGLDNWIYSANSRKRYRKVGGQWIMERTHFRGQWGISQDNFGRLFYNNNSANLLGDYFPPGVGAYNSNQRAVAGFNESIIKDKRVYPVRPTPGVNRAYRRGTLDERQRLRNVTAACSPVVYRGGLFGDEFDQSVFVAEPAGNLVKRNVFISQTYPVRGQQAYTGKEFLASTDERFRPVSLCNGPDGALYIVDMYRGIIEHKTYLTDYLKEEIKNRGLSQPLDLGRIYKVIPVKKEVSKVGIPEESGELVHLLGHPNGWVRDRAQQMLVEGKHVQVASTLREFLKSGGDHIRLVHALWTLEGLGRLQTEDLLPLLKHPVWAVRMNALSVLPAVTTKDNYRQFLTVLENILAEKDTLSAPLVAFCVQALRPFDQKAADDLLNNVTRQNPENEFVADAVISNLENKEAAFLKQVVAFDPDTNLVIHRTLRTVLSDISNVKLERRASILKRKFPEGFALYESTCQACHGADGNGIKSLAPPLNRSEWVNGDKGKLAAIVLFGLTGRISVNGKLYNADEAGGDMPGIGSNQDVTDTELAQLLSFIRASWANDAGEVKAADLARVRNKYSGRERLFTVEELSLMN